MFYLLWKRIGTEGQSVKNYKENIDFLVFNKLIIYSYLETIDWNFDLLVF